MICPLRKTFSMLTNMSSQKTTFTSILKCTSLKKDFYERIKLFKMAFKIITNIITVIIVIIIIIIIINIKNDKYELPD